MVTVCFVVSIALIVPSEMATGACFVSCFICMPSIPSIFMPGMSSARAENDSVTTVLTAAIRGSFIRVFLEGGWGQLGDAGGASIDTLPE
ncbi:hypothetical protein D3C81_2059290 [compost metagenome]